MTVYHGTRQSSAAGTLREGFHPIPVADQIAAVADTYEVPLVAVEEHLQLKSRFTHHDARGGTLSTTGDIDQAGSWANRAPEATYEALWSVYAHCHPELGDDYFQADEGHFWVMAQQMADPPVVVEARAPLGALRAWQFDAGKTAIEILSIMLMNGRTVEDFRRRFARTPEWRVAVDQVTMISPVPAHTRVSRLILEYMSAEDPDTFGEQLSRGRWADPDGYGRDGMPWWSFDTVWSWLTPQRRAQLEQVAGRQLSRR